MYRYTSLLLVLVVLVAGCASTTPGGVETPTVTPTMERTTTPSPSLQPLAPGVTTDGIENVTALLAAHQRGLTETGFVTESASRRTAAGAEFTVVEWTVTVAPGGDRVLARVLENRPDGSQVNAEIWSNATHDVTRREVAGNVSYTTGPRLADDTVVWSGSGVHTVLRTMPDAFVVEGVETRNGHRYVTLVATEGGAEGLDSLTTLVVDERGYIHEVVREVRLDAETTVTTTYRVVQVGGTDPQPPAWLDRVE